MDHRRESVALFRQIDDAERLDDVPINEDENIITLSGVRPAIKSPARSLLRDIFKSVGDDQKSSPTEKKNKKKRSSESLENDAPKKSETPASEARPTKIPTFRSPRTALQTLTSPTRPQPRIGPTNAGNTTPAQPPQTTPSSSAIATRSKQQTTPSVASQKMPPPSSRPHPNTLTPVRKPAAPSTIITPSAIALHSPATSISTNNVPVMTPVSKSKSPLSAPVSAPSSSVVTSVETLPPRTRAQFKKAAALSSPTSHHIISKKPLVEMGSPATRAKALKEWEDKIEEAIRIGSPIGRVYVRSSPPGSDKKT